MVLEVALKVYAVLCLEQMLYLKCVCVYAMFKNLTASQW